MTTLAIGSSVTVPFGDGGTVRIATNGGFATAVVTRAEGGSFTESFGPLPQRELLGPFSEGASVVITNVSCASLDYDVTNGLVYPPTTWANRPSAAVSGSEILITDVGANGYTRWRSDGTLWRPAGPQDIFIDWAAVAMTASAAEQIVTGKQYTVPASLLSSVRYFSVKVVWTKTGTTDTVTPRIRIGAAGTTLDASIYSSAALITAGNASVATESVLVATSNTNIRRVAKQTGSTAWDGASSSLTHPQNITVTDLTAAAQIISLSTTNSGATDTSGVAQVIITVY